MADNGGGLGPNPIGLSSTRGWDSAGTMPAGPAAIVIGAAGFSDEPAVVDTVETESLDWAGNGQPQWPIVGPLDPAWCLMQQS